MISNGLFTLAQLQQLGGVFQQLRCRRTAGQAVWDGSRPFDLKLSYPRKFGEHFTVEPSVSVFNAFNNANFDLPSSDRATALNLASAECIPGLPPVQSIIATAPSTAPQSVQHNSNRVLPGSGVFDLGAPRVVEFGLKLSF